MHTITTWSGKTIDYADQRLDQIDILDIATSLSRECRYAGHALHYYSVAQHSVLASHIVPPALALEALLHDAAEAYLRDIPSPLKALLPDYRRLEEKFDAAIRERFGLPEAQSPEIKEADLVLLATERRDLFPSYTDEWPIVAGIEPMRQRIWPLAPEMAKEQFLARYRSLAGERGAHKQRISRVA